MFTHVKIKHPEWLEAGRLEQTLRLYFAGRLPKTIEGYMLVTAMRHDLRAIYGGDFRAAFALLVLAVHSWWTSPRMVGRQIWFWRAAHLFLRTEDDYWIARGLDAKDLECDRLDSKWIISGDSEED